MLPDQVICLKCGRIFKPDDGDVLICPECGSAISRPRYDRLIDYAHEVGRFGIQYRIRLEKDLTEDPKSRRRHFLIPLGDTLTFCALAALSGVIGGAAYDLIKAAVHKVVRQTGAPADEREARFVSEITTDEGLKRFIKYAEDYNKGFRSNQPEVTLGVIEELLVHRVTMLLPKAPPADFNVEMFLEENKDKLVHMEKPSKAELQDAWTRLTTGPDEEHANGEPEPR